jgi:hypothetical protein
MSVEAPAVRRRLYPSIPAIVFLIWGFVVPIGFGNRVLNADGDLLRHIRHGDWMLAHGRLITADPFSFSRPGEAFVGFEYGSQLVYALVHRYAGLAGVAILVGLLVATAYALLTRFLLTRGLDPLLAYLVSIAAALLGAVHWTARPHLFTLVLVMVLLHLLEPAGRRRPSWVFLPLFVLWANLHGGFLFGLILIGLYLAGSLLEIRFGDDPAAWRAKARYCAEALGFAVAATFLTPHGIALHRHIVDFFTKMGYLHDTTHEFLSPDFHTTGGKMLMLAILAMIGLLAISRTRPAFPRLLVALATVAFALQARRNTPLLGATALPLLALHFDPLWRALPDWRGIRAVFERDARRAATWPYVVPAVLLLGALALGRGTLGGARLVTDGLDPREFPVEAVEWARKERLTGRLWHDFIWGGYVLYAWPEQKVFIDGGTDFYGVDLTRTYIETAELAPGWRANLEKWNISLAVVRTYSPLAAELGRESGWRLRHCDGTAAVFQREAGAGSDGAGDPLERCKAREASDTSRLFDRR